MLKLALVLLLTKIGFGLVAFELVEFSFTPMAQWAYALLMMAFFYTLIVGGVERILKWFDSSSDTDTSLAQT